MLHVSLIMAAPHVSGGRFPDGGEMRPHSGSASVAFQDR